VAIKLPGKSDEVRNSLAETQKRRLIRARYTVG
jgi:hypothetical protein